MFTGARPSWYDERPVYPSPPTSDQIAEIGNQTLRLYQGLWDERTASNHQLRIYPERLCDWHRQLFATTWSDGCGRFRDKSLPTKHYAIQIEDAGGLREGRRSGALGGRKVVRRVERICSEFRAEVGQRPFVCSLDLEGRVNLASYIFVELFRVQPFMYGNFAVAWTALNVAYKRMSLYPLFPFPRDDAFGAAFAAALRAPGAEGRELLDSVLLGGDGTAPLSIAPPTKKASGKGLMHPSSAADAQAAQPQ